MSRYQRGGVVEIKDQSGIELEKSQALKLVLDQFFEHQILIKMFHFQTTKYAAHKATDAYLCKFNANMDRFMEVAQGIKDYGGDGRKVFGTTVELNIGLAKTITDLINVVEDFIRLVLMNKMEGKDPKYSGLAAIRDEMIADAQQLVYLLKFE